MGFVSESVVLELLGLLVAALLTVYIYLKYGVYNFWSKRGVIQDEPIVPIGTLWSSLTKQHSLSEYFAVAYEKFKRHRYFGTYSFHLPTLVIADPDLVRSVLVKDFQKFHDRGVYCNEKADPLSGHLFVLSGSRWKNLRNRLTPTFTSGKMKYMFGTVKDCGEELVKLLEDNAKAREVVKMKDILARYSTDVIASTAFGIQCNSLKDPNSEFCYWASKTFEPKPLRNALSFLAPNILHLFSVSSTAEGVRNFFVKVFNDTVSYRKKNGVSRRDFLQLLMQLMDKGYVDEDENEKKNEKTDKTGVRLEAMEAAAQAYEFYIAGFETSSSTTTHLLYELAINPDIQEKVRADIDRGLEKSGGVLSYESLSEMPYLHKALSESLRKYPSVPILNRICTEEYTIPGTDVVVPKGTPLVVPILGLHRDPDLYPEPDVFDPERFSDENIASRNQYAYLPFGEGPRVCIGMRLGQIQSKVAIISLLSKYRFKPGPDLQVPLEFDRGNVVMCSIGGVPLLIEPR